MPSNLSSKPNKERAVLLIVPLLVFQLLLLSVQIQNPAGMAPIKTLLLAIQAPITSVASGITGGIKGVWKNYLGLLGVRAENEALKDENEQLTRLNRSYEEVRKENIRLQRLVSMNENFSYRTLGARVIIRAPGFLSNVLYINRGTKDGIMLDSPVISGDGIIGRISVVTEGQSQVQLLTNPDASIGAMIEETRTLGVLSGRGDSLLDLKYISNAEQVNLGDRVLSSGVDEIYPKGYLIGKVADSQKRQGGFYDIEVEPAVDLYHIEEVSVLLMDP